MNKLKLIPFLLLPLFLIGCASPSSPKKESGGDEPGGGDEPSEDEYRDDLITYDDITTKEIDNLDKDFIFGMDASAVPSLEASGVKYYDKTNKKTDVFKILADRGVNYIRVRIWNDPYDSNKHGYGGGNCDLDNAIAIGKRATQYGMKVLANFHYSDFWADPGRQLAPKAWASYTVDQKASAIYDYTKASLKKMKDNNIDVGMVQIGNETNNGKVCGESTWDSYVTMMKSASKAVREVLPNSLVAVHFTNPEKGRYPSIAKTLSDNKLDYDVFGTSYYPYWHGTLDNLKSTLSTVASTYNKKTMVLETSYAFTTTDTDYHGNTSPKGSDVTPHEISIQGQYDQVYDVINTAKDTTNCIGVCYWEGTWISVGGKSWNDNKTLWEKYGSGWATSYAASYDPDGVGDWYGGTAVDNQAFFDYQGKELPSLAIFSLEKGKSITPSEETEYLVNGSFEEKVEPWTVEVITENQSLDTCAIYTSSFETSPSSLNLWDPDPIEFNVKQSITNIPIGTHNFKMSLMGNYSDEYTMELYAKEGTSVIATKTVTTIGAWNSWSSNTLSFTNTSTSIEVGIHINFIGSGGFVCLDSASVK